MNTLVATKAEKGGVMVESFAKALLYAQKFSLSNHGRFPHLFHQISGRGTGFYCPECDPKVERLQHQATDVRHLKDCPYLAFRRALTAAKQLDASPIKPA